MIFDGRAFAKEIEKKVKEGVSSLPAAPKIVSVLVGDDPASVLYTRLKKEAAERVGIQFEVIKLESTNNQIINIKQEIERIVSREDVDGVMVQMPIPGLSRDEQAEVLKAIPLDKDVDGLRWEESGIMPATVRAILSILKRIAELRIMNKELWESQFVVVGSHGSVGKPLVHFLKEKGVKDIIEINSKTENPTRRLLEGEVVISCVGKSGLVREIMPGAIAVDVGISKVEGKTVGDMTSEVYNTASVVVPVPGGVGPVTVASLMENTIYVYEKCGNMQG